MWWLNNKHQIAARALHVLFLALPRSDSIKTPWPFFPPLLCLSRFLGITSCALLTRSGDYLWRMCNLNFKRRLRLDSCKHRLWRLKVLFQPVSYFDKIVILSSEDVNWRTLWTVIVWAGGWVSCSRAQWGEAKNRTRCCCRCCRRCRCCCWDRIWHTCPPPPCVCVCVTVCLSVCILLHPDFGCPHNYIALTQRWQQTHTHTHKRAQTQRWRQAVMLIVAVETEVLTPPTPRIR